MLPAEDPEIHVVNPEPVVSSLLLIAPHGYNQFDGKEKDADYIPEDYDEFSGEITEEVAGRIGCKALINWAWKKETYPARNYNRRSQAKADQKFMRHLQAAARTPAPLLVLWIHGARDRSIETEKEAYNAANPGKERSELHAVLGYGQGKDSDRLSADPATVLRFLEILDQKGMTAVPASAAKNRNKFCATEDSNMCQWFNCQKPPCPNVQSIQMEIRRAGFRQIQYVARTADILTAALAELLGIAPAPRAAPALEPAAAASAENLSKAVKDLLHASRIRIRVLWIDMQ